MKKSKGFLRFNNRTLYFRADCEFADILDKNIELLAGDGEDVLKNIAPIKHATYKSTYKNTPFARKLFVNHFQYTLYSSFIKELYEETTEYFRYILIQGAKNTTNVNRIVGEHKTNFDANSLLSTSTHEEVIQLVIENIFQQLENERSTVDLINKIKRKLGLTISDNIVNEALPYLLLRHILVHSDGKPNKEFTDKYQTFIINKKGRCELSLRLVSDAHKKILLLIKEFDKGMILNNFFLNDELQP